MKQAIQLPNGYFNKEYTTFVNLEVGKSKPERKGKVTEQGDIVVNTINKRLYRIDFPNNTFAWHIN